VDEAERLRADPMIVRDHARLRTLTSICWAVWPPA
jgi:hypothetical protein